MATTHTAVRTRDHDEIRQWVEERGGFPATVEATSSHDEPGILRIDFPDYSGGETLKRINWESFFAKFDEEELDFLYQDETAGGKTSRFCKFVSGDDDYESSTRM
jgi:hypothetical protein